MRAFYQCKNVILAIFFLISGSVRFIEKRCSFCYGLVFGFRTLKIPLKINILPVKRNKSLKFAVNSYPQTLSQNFWCAQIYLDEKKNLFVLDCIELPFPSFLDLYGQNGSLEMIPLLIIDYLHLSSKKTSAQGYKWISTSAGGPFDEW